MSRELLRPRNWVFGFGDMEKRVLKSVNISKYKLMKVGMLNKRAMLEKINTTKKKDIDKFE